MVFWWVHINLIFIRRSIHCSAHTKNYYPNDFIHVILHYIEHAMLCYVMFSEKKVIDCRKNNVIKCRTKNILPESRLSHTLSFESYGKYELHFSVFHCGPVFLQRERLVYSTNSPFHAVRSIFTVSNHHHHSFHIS